MICVTATWPDGTHLLIELPWSLRPIWTRWGLVESMMTLAASAHGRTLEDATWQILPEPRGEVVMVP